MTSPSGRPYRTLALHALLLLLAALFLLPFGWLVAASFNSDSHRLARPSEWTPSAQYIKRPGGAWREVLQAEDLTALGRPGKLRVQITDWSGSVNKSVVVNADKLRTRKVPIVRNYLHALRALGFAAYLQHSLVICLVSVVATTLTSALVAYAFSMLRWPGRDLVFYLVLGTMLVPTQITMVPLFVLFQRLGWVNSYAPLLVGSFFGNALGIFLLRRFFLTIPRDLVEAARLDGCPEWRIFSHLILPLATPALAVVALLTFCIRWSEFLTPLIYLSDKTKDTFTLGLAMFQGQHPVQQGELLAMAVLLTLPVAVVFLFAQKTLIHGVKTTFLQGELFVGNPPRSGS